MGDLRTCPSGSTGATGACGAASAGAGACACGAMVWITSREDCPAFTIRTFSSPSVISSSAIPDSCTRSISFFSLRRSTFLLFQGVLQCQVVAAAAQAADGSDGDVGEV